MLKSNKNYTVIRDYQCLYDIEELIRRIIRHHVREAYGKNEVSGFTDHERNSHAEYDG